MNKPSKLIKKWLYRSMVAWRGYNFPLYHEQYYQELASGFASDYTKHLLRDLLIHCLDHVPYYAKLLKSKFSRAEIDRDPEQCLAQLPILNKQIIRENFNELKSADLAQRKWFYNTSGGSTGEPIRLIQDREYSDRSTALTLLYSRLVGYEVGDAVVYLWGSERDLFEGTMGWQVKVYNFLENKTYLNAFRMTPEKMRQFMGFLNAKRPKLIVAYAQAIYELAKFVEQEMLKVNPQQVIITSAGTLYPFMRDTIQSVFRCKVFNRYGSREVGDVACERPDLEGLWIAPWGCYVEVVNDDNDPAPIRSEGNLLITSLTNRAMPLLRYRIGDRSILNTIDQTTLTLTAQVLKKVSGRITDNFRTRNGKIIPGEYFVHLLGVVLNKDGSIRRFQLIQKDFDRIAVKIVKEREIDVSEIIAKIQLAMESPCDVDVEYVEHIEASPSGKYSYTISEI